MPGPARETPHPANVSDSTPIHNAIGGGSPRIGLRPRLSRLLFLSLSLRSGFRMKKQTVNRHHVRNSPLRNAIEDGVL